MPAAATSLTSLGAVESLSQGGPAATHVSITDLSSITQGTAGLGLTSTATVEMVYRFAAIQTYATQTSFDMISRQPAPLAGLSSAAVEVLVKGRVLDRRFRSWTFTVDGHDFYVLRLGEVATVVFDMATGQWARWDSHGIPCFRGHLGHNWHNAGKANYESGLDMPVIAGDEETGVIWALKAFSASDDAVEADQPSSVVTRRVGAVLPLSGRQSARNNAVYLTISNGDPGFLYSTIGLKTSDDNGRTWVQREIKPVKAGQWNQELRWRSLGLMRAPGRIFEFTDNSATLRIDRLDVRVDGKTE